MNTKTFERDLPRGYRLVQTVDAKDTVVGLLLTLGSFVLMVPAVVLLMIPVFASFDRFFEDTEQLLAVMPAFLVITVAYLILHELVHGIAYKKLTGEKLTFGISWSCAYCGVPHIFTYRKTALISVLAPFVVFTVVFLVILPFAFAQPWLYLALTLVFGMHIGGCIGDLYVACLFLFKYKNPAALMNDTGPCMTFFLPTGDPTAEPDEATVAFFVQREAQEQKKSTDELYRASPKKYAVAYSVVGIVLCAFFATFTALVAFSESALLYPPDEKAFYGKATFWMFVLLIALAVWFAVTLKKYAKRKAAILVAVMFLWMPCFFIGGMADAPGISVTADFADYGVYDTQVHLPDYVPTTVTEDMIPVAYSYYYDNSWDWCYEHCLEVRMTDTSYASLKAAYADDLLPCWYAEGYEEYAVSDDLGRFYPTHTDHPDIKKIIFCDTDNTVIYVTMYGIDPFFFENSYYFARFSLDPVEYYEKITVSAN